MSIVLRAGLQPRTQLDLFSRVFHHPEKKEPSEADQAWLADCEAKWGWSSPGEEKRLEKERKKDAARIRELCDQYMAEDSSMF